MTVYYNEIDPYAAQWLRNLMAAGHIAEGEVDERSITEVQHEDLSGFDQCHFFAGIGVWSHALRRAGWPDDRPVWTGSCPCQPFSAAGKQRGFDDERHLWPVWYRLIDQCRPPVVLGEQVASALDWLDLVSADMETSGYAFGASDLCAAGFGGAHIRQRLYFVAMADAAMCRRESRSRNDGICGPDAGESQSSGECSPVCTSGSMDDAAGARRIGPVGGAEGDPRHKARLRVSGAGRGDGGLADADCRQRKRLADGEGRQHDRAQAGRKQSHSEPEPSGGANWTHAPLLGRDAADWLYCRDGKWRPVEPGTFPLAHEVAARVGRLRAYGNALDAETAAQFICAVMDCSP